MHVWFFYDKWLDSCGHSHPVYYAVTETGGHVTNGSTLAQAIYMAHDVIACLTMPPSICEDEMHILSVDEAAETMELPVNSLVMELDIDIEHSKHGIWVRKGDPLPLKKAPTRIRMLERAFCLLYRNGL